MEDSKKVKKRLTELNKGLPGQPWIAVDGNNTMPFLSTNLLTGVKSIDNSSGYSVKVFVHSETGEIKLYAARLLEK